MKTRVVYGVEATCEVLPASALPAAIRRRESVHATMTVRRSADVYKESPDKDSSKASLSDDAHALSAQFLQLYERFRRPIHSSISRLLGSQEDAEESFFLPPDDGGIPAIAEREHIRLAIANMPEQYAAALVLNVAQGVPYQEVAAIVGISPNAAATRISRAKKMFVEHYQRVSRTF